MAATSPYSPNDYQAVSNFRPYELPINDIFKAISAQNQFWDAGAARIKSYYDKGSNLDLTIEENRKLRDEYMINARKEIDKLSAGDVSSPSIQQMGFEVMKPLFNDKSILYDDGLTRLKKSIYADAESYRGKKLSPNGIEGEGYSTKNLAFALDGFEDFNNNTPRDERTLKNLYEKLANRKYIPQYDATREYSKIINNCTGSSESVQDVADGNYLYFDVSSKTGATSSEMTNCFMMGLSPMAKQQLAIDGWAYYKSGNQPYTDLAADHYTMKVGKYKQRKEALQASLKGLEDRQTKSEKDKQDIEKLKVLLNEATTLYDEAESEFNNMTSNNGVEYAKSNFQSLAGSVYMQRFLQNIGETYRNDNISRKLIPNAAGIAQYNAYERERLMYIQNSMDRDKIMLKAQLDYNLEAAKGAVGIIPLPLNPRVLPGEDNVFFTPEMQMEEENIAYSKLESARNTITEYISRQLGKPVTETEILNYTNSVGDGNETYNEILKVYNLAKEDYEDKVLFRKSVEERMKLSNKESYDKLANEKVTLSDGTVVSGADIMEGIENVSSTSEQEHPRHVPTESVSFKFTTKNGKVHIVSNSEKQGDSKKLYDLYKKYEEYISNNNESFTQEYSKKWYEANRFFTPNFNIDKNLTLQNYVTSVTGLTKPGAKGGYNVFGIDKDATSIFVTPLDSEGNEVTSKDGIKKLLEKSQGRSGMVDVGMQRIGTNEYAIRLTPRAPGVIPTLPNTPIPSQIKDINKLRNFQTAMESLLKGNYASSEDLKDNTGNPYALRNITITTPTGKKVKIHAQLANGVVSLVPSYESTDGKGGWITNSRSFTNPEELIIRLGDFYGNTQSQNLFNIR